MGGNKKMNSQKKTLTEMSEQKTERKTSPVRN